MLEIGHKGTLHRDGRTIRAKVIRVRGGNRVDLMSPKLPPDQLQMVPIGAGEGCFFPDAYEVQPVEPEAPTPRLVPVPEKRHRYDLAALVLGGIALGATIAEWLLR